MKTTLFALLPFLLLLITCGDDPPAGETTELQTTTTGDPGIDQITAQLVDEPDRADLYAVRAEMEYKQGNYDGAIADLQRAIGLDSTEVGYYFTLSDVFMEYFRSRQAIGTLQAAVELNRDNPESWLRLGEAQLVTKQYDEAISSLNEVTRIDPRNPDAYLILGQVFSETADTVRAINATQEAVEIDPDLVDGWIKLGQLYAAQDNPRAENYLKTALALDTTDVISLSALAEYYWQEVERPDEALALYRQAAMIDRQYVSANYNLGLMLMELGRVEEAREEFNIVTQNDPLHIQAYFYKGYANELLGDIDVARSDYRNALRLAPDYELALEGMARVENQ